MASRSERSELRRLVARLSARPANAAPRSTADAREIRRVVELLGRAGRQQRAHTISGGVRRNGTLRRLNLLLINQNDRRVMRLRLRRWPVVVAILGAILLTVTRGTISRDYAGLPHQRAALP